MKVIFLILILCIASAVAFSQTLVNEFEKGGTGGCDPYFQLTYLLDEVNKHPGSTGLILVFDGGDKERFGNLLAFVRNADGFTSGFLKQPGKIRFAIASGKTFFYQQHWLIPENSKQPEFRPGIADWDSLQGRYHFSNACLGCEPSYPSLSSFQPNFEDYARLLKEHAEYLGIVQVHNDDDIHAVAKALTHERRIPRGRYKIIRTKTDEENDLNVDLFLERVDRSERSAK